MLKRQKDVLNPFDRSSEELALNILSKYDSERFSNMKLKDKPDLQSENLNIGVEVTFSDFKWLPESFLICGKSAAAFLKQNKVLGKKKETFPDLKTEGLNDFTKEIIFEQLIKGLVFVKKKELVWIDTLSVFLQLGDYEVLYDLDQIGIEVDSNGIIVGLPPKTFWYKESTDKLIKDINRKVEKSKGYSSFKSNYLLVLTISAEKEEFSDLFERKEEIKRGYFDAILLANCNDYEVFEITLD